MEQALISDLAQPGGGFLVSPVPRGGITIPEEMEEEQEQLAEAAGRFMREQVWPRVEEIENKAKPGGEPLAITLTREAAELGLASMEIPDEFGGLGMDLLTSMLVSEQLCGCASFAVTLGAHCGIGTLPILYFGNQEQKEKYLPKLATAEIISCYALTEPGNGSDALGGKTTAVRSEDGTHFILNGQKQFITNGTWADLAVVFASIDGKYSGLIVDLHSEGVERGAEEKKMGILGSSTTGLVFQDVKVPVENQLGATGAAPQIALNILGVGRMKLGFSCLGTAKYALDLTVKFIHERKQFGRPIFEFDLQQGKLAEMTAWIYGCESLHYRLAGAAEHVLSELPEDHEAMDEMAVMRRFGLECALSKISGSETASRVLYHSVRMHGGYGFCEEYQVERLTRDNVVDTIFEGTNDINRLVMAGGLVESCYMGSIPFQECMDAVHERLAADSAPAASEEYLGAEVAQLEALKQALAYTTEQVLLNTGKDIRNEQQVMLFLADGLIAAYTAESALARTIQVGAEHAQAAVRADVVRLILDEAEQEVARVGAACLEHVVPERELPRRREDLARLLPKTPRNIVTLKRRIATHVNAAGRYDLRQEPAMTELKKVGVVDFARSPISKAKKGKLLAVTPVEIAHQVITQLMERNPKVPKDRFEMVVCGTAYPEGEQGLNVARQIAIKSGFPVSVAGITVNQFCASSQQAVMMIADALACGKGDIGLAIGMEHMARIPQGGYNPAFDPELYEKNFYISMGDTAENLANEGPVSREDQESFAMDSHRKALKAWSEDAFAKEVVPIALPGGGVADRDEFPQEPNPEKISSLKPAFNAKGTVTAATSSPLSIGVAVVIVATEEAAAELGFKLRATIEGTAVAGCDYERMGLGPIPATEKVMKRTGLSMNDMDVVELNEAFASQSLAVIRQAGWTDHGDKINILGGALALGHPLGMSGARIIGTAITALEKTGGTYGLATMCVGGGQGASTILKRVGA